MGLGEKSSVKLADPSWPYLLYPQHQMVSFNAIAHVCLSPAAIRPVGSIAEIETFARTRTGEGTAKYMHAVKKIAPIEPVRRKRPACS